MQKGAEHPVDSTSSSLPLLRQHQGYICVHRKKRTSKLCCKTNKGVRHLLAIGKSSVVSPQQIPQIKNVSQKNLTLG